MRRFRILFLVIAVVVVVPVGLLVHRAVQSVELERSTRHQAVAERIFDEMERALSELLAREEERPFGEYSYEYIPQGQDGGARLRSPLAEPPTQKFIVGYFQLDPGGGLQTPLQPPAAARLTLAELGRTVTPYFRAGGGAKGGSVRTSLVPQLPGTTVAAKDEAARRDLEDKRQRAPSVSAFDALRALNKGIEQRAARQPKTELQYAEAPRPTAEAPVTGLVAPQKLDAPAAAAQALQQQPARLEIMPMIGHVVDPHHLLLYRTVVRDAQTYRQGLLLDLDALAAWLRREALGTDGVATYATVDFTNRLTPAAIDEDKDVLREPQHERSQSPSNEVSSVRPEALEGRSLRTFGVGAYVYQHRFADPFADLSARLVLRPLPGVGSANYVYALCGLVLLAGGVGLLALYRMVSVTVSYAERRSNFVAAVSHELKTPLTAIRMYGEMLRDGIVPAEAKRAEYYRHITAESERLSRLINNVLEFSRLEKGNRQVALVTGTIGPLVIEAAELLRPHAEGAGFALDVEVDPALPPVHFERDALLQILFNLVDNAVKYARDGSPKRISLSCRTDGGAVHLAVRDHGPGVAARHLRRLFEPFYRGESELTRRSKGSGLGLALVQRLARQMGASATACNVAAGGFEVELVFPAA
jgi:signal transduction histidine kinase